MDRDPDSSKIPWLGIAIAVLPGILLVVLTIHRAQSMLPLLRPDRPNLARSFAVMTAVRALEQAIEDADRGQRGFLITGEPRYLAAYGRGAERARANLARLLRLTAGEPEQQRRLALLRQQLSAQLAGLQGTIAVRQSAGADAARAIVAKEARFDAIGVIGGILDNIGDAERAAIQASRQEALLRRSEAALAGVLAAGLAAALALSGGSLAAIAFIRLARAQARLGASEECFRMLVSQVKEYAILMLDPVGRIVSWNAGAERIAGYKAEEILGRRFSCFYPEEAIAARAPELHLQCASSQGTCAAACWRVRKDGSRFWADAVITAVHGPDGRLRGFAEITRDAAAPTQPL